MNRYIKSGEKFLRNCVFDGLAHSYNVQTGQYVKPYPEVTGYVIKYLCDNSSGNEMNNIIEAGHYLAEIQHKKGGYKTFYDKRYLYSFDTAQILNGLISLYIDTKEQFLYGAIENAGKFLLYMQRGDGAIYPVYDTYLRIRCMPKNMYHMWNGPTSGLLCKLTEVYNEMFKLTNDDRYQKAINHTCTFYKQVEPIVYTHPLGYWLEGLYAGGEEVFVKDFLEKEVICRIEKNGFMAYAPELNYSYTSGEIQLAILMVKTGLIEPALVIRDFARKVQMNSESGGIFQFTNREAELDNHVHTEINSWGTKYYCELERITERYD